MLLTGGSAFGLDSATGVMRYLEERGRGYPVGPSLRVPIVPGAVIFDLGVGDSDTRPDAEMGYQACQNATDRPVVQGQIGAGTGATVGASTGVPGGIGSAARRLEGGLVVAAIVVVNAFGNVYDPNTGTMVAGKSTGLLGNSSASPFGNTTIGVIATNASLDRTGATKVAQMAHDGLARVIRPIHTMFDGDTIFALAAGIHPSDTNSVGILAADAMEMSVLRAVQRSTHAG